MLTSNYPKFVAGTLVKRTSANSYSVDHDEDEDGKHLDNPCEIDDQSDRSDGFVSEPDG